MTITKETTIDKIEIVGEFKQIQIREKTDIIEGENVISSSFHRRVVDLDADLTDYPQEIQDIANVIWTQAVKNAWTTFKNNQE